MFMLFFFYFTRHNLDSFLCVLLYSTLHYLSPGGGKLFWMTEKN